MATLTETLDTLYTTTWQHMRDEIRDNVFDSSPFWFWLRDKGKLKSVEGGRWISEPIAFDKNDQIVWLGKGGTTSLADYEFLTIAKYDWKYLACPIVRFGVDDQQNRGKMQIINILEAKMENTRNALINEMETTLFQTNAATLKEPYGLQNLIQDAPATGSVGGIDTSIAANAYWKNIESDLTGKSFAVYGVSYMRTLLNNCMKNLRQDRPDIIVCGQTPYEYYEDETMEQKQIVNKTLGDASFQNIEFKGLPMIWSPSCADTRMYFLNTNFIYFVYDPMMFFDMTEWKAIPDQVNDRAAQIATACSFQVSRRKCQGVLHTIDTA